MSNSPDEIMYMYLDELKKENKQYPVIEYNLHVILSEYNIVDDYDYVSREKSPEYIINYLNKAFDAVYDIFCELTTEIKKNPNEKPFINSYYENGFYEVIYELLYTMKWHEYEEEMNPRQIYEQLDFKNPLKDIIRTFNNLHEELSWFYWEMERRSRLNDDGAFHDKISEEQHFINYMFNKQRHITNLLIERCKDQEPLPILEV